jgi:hypothetical protein
MMMPSGGEEGRELNENLTVPMPKVFFYSFTFAINLYIGITK